MAKSVTDRTFTDEVLKNPHLTLVDFWAPWCGPCRMVGPIVDELASEYAGRADVVKLNVDENPITAMRYGIMSIPTLLLFRDGRIVDQIVGVRPKHQITAVLERWLAAA